MLYPTPIAAMWLIFHQLRHPPKALLPAGLAVLLLVVAAGWIVTIGILVNNLDHLYRYVFWGGLDSLANTYESAQGLILP
jgi:hypothetical protein